MKNRKLQILSAAKDALAGNVKTIRYELDKLGVKRRERWFYQLAEDIPGRESLLVTYDRLMLAWKRADFQSYELFKFKLECLGEPEIVGFPQLTAGDMAQQLVVTIETDIRKFKDLIKVITK